VARDAVRGEPGRLVVGIRRRIVLRLVTRIADWRQAGVNTPLVAVFARQRCVRALQRKSRRAVVEHPLIPSRVSRLVAQDTVGRKPGRVVVRIRRRVGVCFVARIAEGGQAGIDAPLVTPRTVETRVGTLQREPGAGMIELALIPSRIGRLVTHDAIGR
jgi:hypothetical protein